MKALVTLACEDILRDTESNAISIHNIIEEIVGQAYPVFIAKFCVFLLSEREKGDKTVVNGEVVIMNNDTELHKFPLKIDFEGKKRNRNIIKIGGFAIPNPGSISIQFHLSKKVYAQLDLECKTIGKPQIKAS